MAVVYMLDALTAIGTEGGGAREEQLAWCWEGTDGVGQSSRTGRAGGGAALLPSPPPWRACLQAAGAAGARAQGAPLRVTLRGAATSAPTVRFALHRKQALLFMSELSFYRSN